MNETSYLALLFLLVDDQSLPCTGYIRQTDMLRRFWIIFSFSIWCSIVHSIHDFEKDEWWVDREILSSNSRYSLALKNDEVRRLDTFSKQNMPSVMKTSLQLWIKLILICYSSKDSWSLHYKKKYTPNCI